ncbi:hypothetical protein A9Q91_00295 [Candidatus Gracilibacteria bacterium 28_42_T64]|nr:hypothetical protein A9Q91_00295 [Candidatus Gracilibacteria bacterium 28_42_T64]
MIKKIAFIFILIIGLLSFANVGFAKCEGDECKIDSIKFQIDVNDITPGLEIEEGDNVEQTINRTLGTIIQKLMIALGSLSLLIMTIGGGYMIMYHGQDELLSKGKSIFLSGITALVVALSSYYMVAFLRYILYS